MGGTDHPFILFSNLVPPIKIKIYFLGFLSQLVQGHGLERCVEGAHYCSRQLITSGPHLDSECPFQ